MRSLLDGAVAADELVPTNTRLLAEAVQVVYNGALVSWAIDPEGRLTDRPADKLELLLALYRAESGN